MINDNTVVLQVQYNTSQQCAVVVSWVVFSEFYIMTFLPLLLFVPKKAEGCLHH